MGNMIRVRGRKNIAALVLSILISEGVGLLGVFFTMGTMKIYKELKVPPFAPPGWIFPVVWTILFLLMGIASYRIWMLGSMGIEVKTSLLLYLIQLVLNFIWTILFFKFQQRGIAFLELIVLWIFILLTTLSFYKQDKIAGYLMIPYLLWVSFAGLLNYSIWMMNR